MQLELNRDISRLQTEMRLFNIGAVPALLVLAIGIGMRAAAPGPARGRGA